MNKPATQENIKLRACSIICKDSPEWGTWGVMEDQGLWYVIQGKRGSRVLSKDEAAKFWVMA
jgi:hypothetical protein